MKHINQYQYLLYIPLRTLLAIVKGNVRHLISSRTFCLIRVKYTSKVIKKRNRKRKVFIDQKSTKWLKCLL